MECPFRLIAWASLDQETRDRGNWIDITCAQGNCPLWNERFGMCALAVDAYLKGQADIRAERGIKD